MQIFSGSDYPLEQPRAQSLLLHVCPIVFWYKFDSFFSIERMKVQPYMWSFVSGTSITCRAFWEGRTEECKFFGDGKCELVANSSTTVVSIMHLRVAYPGTKSATFRQGKIWTCHQFQLDNGVVTSVFLSLSFSVCLSVCLSVSLSLSLSLSLFLSLSLSLSPRTSRTIYQKLLYSKKLSCAIVYPAFFFVRFLSEQNLVAFEGHAYIQLLHNRRYMKINSVQISQMGSIWSLFAYKNVCRSNRRRVSVCGCALASNPGPHHFDLLDLRDPLPLHEGRADRSDEGLGSRLGCACARIVVRASFLLAIM